MTIFFTGLIIGLIIGIVVGIMFANHNKGKASIIDGKLDDLVNKVADKAKDIIKK